MPEPPLAAARSVYHNRFDLSTEKRREKKEKKMLHLLAGFCINTLMQHGAAGEER
jgi:hypothetical protein